MHQRVQYPLPLPLSQHQRQHLFENFALKRYLLLEHVLLMHFLDFYDWALLWILTIHWIVVSQAQ